MGGIGSQGVLVTPAPARNPHVSVPQLRFITSSQGKGFSVVSSALIYHARALYCALPCTPFNSIVMYHFDLACLGLKLFLLTVPLLRVNPGTPPAGVVSLSELASALTFIHMLTRLFFNGSLDGSFLFFYRTLKKRLCCCCLTCDWEFNLCLKLFILFKARFLFQTFLFHVSF